jgi:hypothetical protein
MPYKNCTLTPSNSAVLVAAVIQVQIVPPGALWEYNHHTAEEHHVMIERSDSMSIGKNATGRPRVVSHAGKSKDSPRHEKKVGQKTPLMLKSRKHAGSEQGSEEIEVVFHSPVDVTAAEAGKKRTRNLPIVHEAKEILLAAGYIPARLSEPSLPVNLIGLGGKLGTLMVLAFRSPVPVPSAVKLRELYTGRVDRLRVLAGKVLHTIMIWVQSPICGWRYYLIYPGGLRYDHDFAAALK